MNLFYSLMSMGLLFSSLGFANVYPDTEHRRRATTTEENTRLLALTYPDGKIGCTASALTPDMIITAEHCTERRMGHFEADPTQTFKIVKVVESSHRYTNDYAILKIQWKMGKAPVDLKYVQSIVHQESDLKFNIDDSISSSLFALGYPMDRNFKASYSQGFLKSTHRYAGSQTLKNASDSLFLKVNIPLNHGNSGGPIYSENYTLVGVVSGGGSGVVTKEVLAAGNYHSQNPKFWNEVVPLYHLYPNMKMLQTLFPNGINPNVNENGEWLKN